MSVASFGGNRPKPRVVSADWRHDAPHPYPGSCVGAAARRRSSRGDSAAKVRECGASDARQMHWVIDSLYFARVTDGVSDGFDLDGRRAAAPARMGAGAPTSPTQRRGRYRQCFGEVIPALENTEFVGAEALINATIRTGSSCCSCRWTTSMTPRRRLCELSSAGHGRADVGHR